MSTLNTNITYNNFRDKSFGLLRTNPKLTTNVKIVIDSNDDIFLSSFSATKQLSSSSFKRFKLNSRGQYSMDLSRFYGSVPMTERFDIMRKFSDIATHHEYSKQFENQYNYGAEFNETKLYDEQYRFLAPIWLEKTIPSNFVVYRVETPTPTNIQNPDSYLGQNEKIMDMLRNATIVANFDLSRKSNIGKYIRNHIEDSTMPNAGLTFDFDTEEPCTYRGIDVQYGGFTNKEEYLGDDYVRKDDLEIHKNELLTNGFERNGLAFSNILNLEFMFDDTLGEKYKTYRYFGLYVDSIKEGGLKLSAITPEYLIYDGATSVYDLTGFSGAVTDPELYMSFHSGGPDSVLSLPTLNYLKDKHYNLYHIKNKVHARNEYKIDLDIADLDAFKGYSKKEGTLTISQKTRSFKGFIKLKLKETPNHLDRFFIGNINAMEEDAYNMGGYICLADSSLDAGQYSGNSFSNKGTLSQVAMAMSNCIKNIEVLEDGRVIATPIAEDIIIESYVVGEDRNVMMFGVYDNNFADFIEITTSRQDDMGLNAIGSGTITFTNWDIHTLRGGAGENQGMLIKSGEHGDVAVGDYIKEKDLESYVKVIDIVRDLNGSDYRVILKKPATLSNNGTIKLYNKFEAEFGKLSAYDLKDLSFDFYDNDISGLGSASNDLGFNHYVGELNQTSAELNNKNLDRFRGLIGNILGSDSVGRISNVYDRLKENELKETAILSRIVPHINTFVRKDSSNIRGNDYILNINESMGIHNMSPLLSAKQSDYRYLNLEHYTMGQLPKLQASIRNNYSNYGLGNAGQLWYDGSNYSLEERGLYNIDDSLIFAYDDTSTDFTGGTGFTSFNKSMALNTSYDYFSLFESFNGYYNYNTSTTASIFPTETFKIESWEDSKKVIHSDIIKRGYVFHKGVRYKFSENLDGYRFMNILRYEHSSTTSETKIEVIKNEKWKTLVILTTILTKENIIPEYGLTKGHMYDVEDISTYDSAVNNAGGAGTYTLVGTGSGFLNAGGTVSTISTGNGVGATVTYTASGGFVTGVTVAAGGSGYIPGETLVFGDATSIFLASMTVATVTGNGVDGTVNTTIPLGHGIYGDPSNPNYTEPPLTLANTPIKTTFDYGGSLWPSTTTPGVSFTLNASQESIDNGDAQFNSQFLRNDVGEYSYIIFDDGAGNRYAAKIIEVISDTSLVLNGYPLDVSGTFTLGTTYYTNMPSHNHDDFILTMHEGGLGGFKALFDSVCVGSVAERFKNNSGVKYATVSELGVIALDEGPVVEIVPPHDVIKTSEKRAIGDTDKPVAFAITSESVGYNVVDKEIKYITKLNRHNGDYNPAVKNIITFDSIYNKHKLSYSGLSDLEKKERLIYSKFNGYGIAFESYKNSIKDYGIIKNFHYHKVNENTELDIIKLSESSDKLPLYPTIGEIAIDKTDLNILDSKYSDSFFKRGLVGLGSENAHGTKSAEEVKAFMASTIMKVNDTYVIDFFTESKNTSLNDLNTTYEEDLNTSSIHFFEDEYRVFADFYLSDSLRQVLISDGILPEFSKNIKASESYGNTTTIKDDLEEYVKHNIINRYVVDSVDVYFNEGRDIQTQFNKYSFDPSQVEGFEKATSYSIELFNDKEAGFRFIFEKRLGYGYSFNFNIKIKA